MKRALITIAASSLLAGAAISAAPVGRADPGCQTVLWGFLGSQRRTICDGPVKADGSWWRQRSIWVPPHQTPMNCYTSGGRYSSWTSCSGGGFVPYTELDYDAYPVTPDTVLPDEPGHLA